VVPKRRIRRGHVGEHGLHPRPSTTLGASDESRASPAAGYNARDVRSTDFRKPSEVTADFRARLALILAPHGFACRAKGARFVRKRGRNVFGGVIGAAVTAWLAPAAPPPAPATVDLAPLQKQIDALSRGNARSAARLTSLEVEGQKPREQTQAPSSDPPQDSEAVPPRRQTPEEQRQEQADLLTAHASEPVDRAWATGTRDEVSRALTQLDHP
jgi:hypothetical protein